MYISFERSSVKKMPVLIMSQRLAARPGIMVANSVRMYSGARPRRLQISLASSTRMPWSWPLSSTNCSGGRVGLIDITRVLALMMVGGAIFACARAAVRRDGQRRERGAGLEQAAAANDRRFHLVPLSVPGSMQV